MSALVAWLRRTLPWSNSPQSWLDRLAVVGVVAGAAALVVLGPRLSMAAQVLLWGLLLAVAAFTSRLFGPVLFYDLVRIARRNRYYLIRVLYALFLLTMLCWVYFTFTVNMELSATVRPDEAARFANSFFYMFMAIQFLVVTVVTPAYVAGAVAEEKERKTLEFLLATDLLNREIVLSKLTSRLLNLMLLVLTGLPVLAALQFLGGIDPLLVIAGFAATMLTVASLAGLSIFASVICRRARDAIVLTYLMAAAYLVLSGLSWLLTVPAGWATFPSTTTWTSPVTAQDVVEAFNIGNVVAVLIQMSQAVDKGDHLDAVLPAFVARYAFFHGTIALLGPLWAVLRLRAIALRETGEPARRTRPVLRLGWRPRLGRFPMIWKEVFADRGLRLHWFGRLVLVLLVLASFVPVVVIGYMFLEGTLDEPFRFFGGRSDPWEALAENTQLWVVRVAGTCVACLLCLAVAVRASSSVSIERDRQTFDGLLTTPLDSDTILFAKWLGAVFSVRRGWLWLGALWGVGLLTGGLHPLALPLLVLTWFIYAAFLAGLGTWFSTVSRTTLRATVWTLLCAVGAALGHWLIWMCCVPIMILRAGPMPDVLEWVAKYQTGLTPPLNLGWRSSFRAGEFLDDPGRPEQLWELVGFGVMGTATWAVLAGALWVITSHRFRQVAGRVAFEPERRLQPKRPPAVLVSHSARQPPAAESEVILEVLPIDDKCLGAGDEDKVKGSQFPSTEDSP
jgi:ABC-type transport system involved in multi-copper enzyme maturation permease subunit